MRAVRIKITGDVQGVFYRHNAKKTADSLKILGWTKNEHDGSVTVVAQGEEDSITRMIEWSREGSPMATVSDVKIENIDTDESLKGFEIR